LELGIDPGLNSSNTKPSVNDSLKHLQTDFSNINYTHEDDPTTPLEEMLEAFTEIIKSGKVRCIAASNYSAPRFKLDFLRAHKV